MQEAIKITHEADALNKAGLAAVTLIEEVETLPPATMRAKRENGLADVQSREVLLKVNDAAGKLVQASAGNLSRNAAIDILLKSPAIWPLEHERELIRRALA